MLALKLDSRKGRPRKCPTISTAIGCSAISTNTRSLPIRSKTRMLRESGSNGKPRTGTEFASSRSMPARSAARTRSSAGPSSTFSITQIPSRSMISFACWGLAARATEVIRPLYLSGSFLNDRLIGRRRGCQRRRSGRSARGAAKNRPLLQVRNASGIVTEPRAEHFPIVLAQHRGVQLQALGKFRESEREPRHVEIPENAIMDRPHRAALAEMRMRDGFGDRQYRGVRHAVLLQRRHRRVVARHRLKPSFDRCDELLEILEAIGVGAKAGILRKLGPIHRAAKPCELMVERGDYDDVAIASLEDSRGHRVPGMQARARRADRSLAQAQGFHRGLVVMEIGIEQGEVEVLPLAGPLAVKERRAYRAHRVSARADIADRAHDHVGRAVRLSAHRCNSGIGRAQVVEARLVGERAVLTEGGNRAHHGARVQFPDDVVPESQPTDHAGSEVLHDHVGLSDQVSRHRETILGLQADATALLAAIVLTEVTAAAVNPDLGAAGGIPRGRHLDLHHLRAHLRHHQSAGRSGDDLGEVQNLVAVEDMPRRLRAHVIPPEGDVKGRFRTRSLLYHPRGETRCGANGRKRRQSTSPERRYRTPGKPARLVAMLPVARQWFSRRPMGDGVTWIWEAHVDPFIRCNIWHVRGRDRDVLIDTGSGISPLREAMAELIDKALDAVATHIHYDHVGGLHEFAVRMMHRVEANRMNPYREFHPIRARDFPESFRQYLPARDGGDDLLLDR